MNQSHGISGVRPLFVVSLLAASLAGCGGGGASDPALPSASVLSNASMVTSAPGDQSTSSKGPSVDSASPGDGAVNVATSTNKNDNVVTGSAVTANFNQTMDPATINSNLAGAQQTFTLKDTSGNNVPGTVAMDAANTAATFTPIGAALAANTSYTATVTSAAKTAGGIALAIPVAWTFMTKESHSIGQSPVSLGKAGTFALLTKSGIT